jgi:hypothetical protein
VLRTRVYATIEGNTGWKTIQTIDRGDLYELVLEWGKDPDKEGLFPARTVSLPKRLFDVNTDVAKPYELQCRYSLNFDEVSFPDTWLGNDVFDDPSKLFQPPPEDEP